MNAFDYFAPTTVAEASELLAHYDGQARVVAGGTDLLLKMRTGKLAPRAIINLKRLPDLRSQAFDGHLCVGALTTLEELRRAPVIQQRYPAVAAACATMASVQIRNLATVGGNLCNAAPSADLAPILMALDATARITSRHGERRVPLDDFFTGPGRSVLADDELLAALEVPAPAGPATYVKLAPRAHMDIAVVGVAVALLEYSAHSQRCRAARVALGAVAPTPLRARAAEAELTAGPLTVNRIERAARLAADEARPIDDVRGSAWYRRRMVQAMTRRGLLALVQSAGTSL